MDINEKAKAYDEAIERAKYTLTTDMDNSGHWAVKYIFPELKESEDERIREALTKMISDIDGGYPFEKYGIVKKDALAYLEKQKDAEAEIEKAYKNADLVQRRKGFEEGVASVKAAEWSEEDEKFFKTALWHISYSVSNGRTTDDHCDTTNWLKGVKERLKSLRPQPKCGWSEEDEENFKWFDKFFRAESVVAGGRDIPQDKYLWFKSLRSRPKASDNWKPSKEQLKALKYVAYHLMPDENYRDEMFMLYEQLKKLMEE